MVDALVEEAERIVAEGIEARLADADAGAEAEAEATRPALLGDQGDDANDDAARIAKIRDALGGPGEAAEFRRVGSIPCGCHNFSCGPSGTTRPTPRSTATGCWCGPATSARWPPGSTPGCRSATGCCGRSEQIVREEMDAAGAQELLLPIIQPLELWQRTGRDKAYGPLMFKLNDRKDTGFALAPTAEEVITVTVGERVRQLPRPAGEPVPVQLEVPRRAPAPLRAPAQPRVPHEGRLLLRRRHRRAEGQLQADVRRLPPRLRALRPVVPPGGGPGRRDRRRREPRVHGRGGGGGGRLRLVPACDYAANVEAAVARSVPATRRPRRERRPTWRRWRPSTRPDLPGIKGVAEFLGVEPSQMLKCIAFDVDGEMGLALVPGDREVNPFALNRALPGRKVRLWEDADFDAHPDVPKGYIGPHFPGATVRVADPAVGVPNTDGWVTGANQVDHHVRHAALGRDFEVDTFADLVTVVTGDACPRCGSRPLRRPRHRGRPHLPARHQVLGGARRRLHRRDRPAAPDGHGLLRHRSVPRRRRGGGGAPRRERPGVAGGAGALPGPPRQPAGKGEAAPEVRAAADRLYDELRAAGVDVLYDDRDQSPGVKFADADLLGMPTQLDPRRQGAGAWRGRTEGPPQRRAR